MAVGSLSQEQEGTPQDLIEVSQCSAFISPNHSGTKSLPISPNIMGKVDVPVPPKMELDQNLVHDAVKDLRLEPPKLDYPIGGGLQHFLSNWKKVQVGKDQEKAQSEKDSHSKNRGGKKTN